MLPQSFKLPDSLIIPQVQIAKTSYSMGREPLVAVGMFWLSA